MVHTSHNHQLQQKQLGGNKVNIQLEPITRSTMNVAEAATYLGVSKDTIYKLCRENRIAHFRLGVRILFKKDKLDEWVDKLITSGMEDNYAV